MLGVYQPPHPTLLVPLPLDLRPLLCYTQRLGRLLAVAGGACSQVCEKGACDEETTMTDSSCSTCSTPLMGVEYYGTPCDYDGISEWQCQACGLRIGRWSRRTLADGELEARWGDGTPYLWRRD